MFVSNLANTDHIATPLPSEVCERFHTDGMVHIPSVFTQDEICTLVEITHSIVNSNSAPSEHLSDGFFSWRAVTTVSADLAGLACDPRLVSIAVQLLGPSIRLVGTQLINRYPYHGIRTIRTPDRPGWHRDIYGMSNDLGCSVPQCAIKCAIWLSDAPLPEYGATCFLLGSHHTGMPAIPDGHINPPGWISSRVLAGDVTVFENRTFHAGGLNTSNTILEVLMVQYGYRWLASVINRHHPFSILDQCSPLARQLLEPDEIDSDGCYRPGTGSAIIEKWATRQGLSMYRQSLATDTK